MADKSNTTHPPRCMLFLNHRLRPFRDKARVHGAGRRLKLLRMNCVSKIYRTCLSDRKTSKNSYLAIDILLCSQNDQLIANPRGPRVQQSASFPGSSGKREDPGNEVAGKDILKDILFTFLF